MRVSTAGAPGDVRERHELLRGVVYERRDGSVALRLDAPWQVLSSAVLGGGRRHARGVVNLRVPATYSCDRPERTLRDAARALGLSGPVVGLMTAVDLAQTRIVAGQAGRASVRAVITVGLRNASRPGEPAVAAPGTINTIFLCDAPLREAAAVELAMLLAEAKAATLIESGLRTSSGRRVSGTSTDAAAILWRRTGVPEIRHAGAATELGELAGRIMAEAIESIVARMGAQIPSEPR